MRSKCVLQKYDADELSNIEISSHLNPRSDAVAVLKKNYTTKAFSAENFKWIYVFNSVTDELFIFLTFFLLVSMIGLYSSIYEKLAVRSKPISFLEYIPALFILDLPLSCVAVIKKWHIIRQRRFYRAPFLLYFVKIFIMLYTLAYLYVYKLDMFTTVSN